MSRCRSAPCCAAAKDTEAAADSAVAMAQTSTPRELDPVSAEISAPIAPPPMKEATIAATSRDCSSFAREIGASSSQKPSAADASTGPNNRLAPSATATAAANAANGRMVRAERQDTVLHCAIVL